MTYVTCPARVDTMRVSGNDLLTLAQSHEASPSFSLIVEFVIRLSLSAAMDGRI